MIKKDKLTNEKIKKLMAKLNDPNYVKAETFYKMNQKQWDKFIYDIYKKNKK